MPETNKEYTVEIKSISSDGNGVGHIDGFTVFVPFTAPGDTARIVLEKLKPRFGEGRLLEIIQPSADRTEPGCKIFTRCGGCQLRHLSYSAELAQKRGIIENAMHRIGGFDSFTLDGITGMENPRRYRNKMIFHLNGHSCGFYARSTHDIIPVSDCEIGIRENSKIISAVTESEKNCEITRIFTRKTLKKGEIMVVLTSNKPIKNIQAIAKRLQKLDKNIVSVIAEVNNKKTVIYGKERIEETLCGVKFEISADSFFQVNTLQTEKLYEKVMEYAALKDSETVMDIYCGAGTISLCAAKKAKKAIGVEIVERAVMDARKNAELNGIKNAEFYAGSAEKIVPKLIADGERPAAVILDPPRKGSDERTLGAITGAKPERIVYVSCNPATLARDARFLADNGYEITKAHGFDLFPRTMHVETVVLLSRVKK